MRPTFGGKEDLGGGLWTVGQLKEVVDLMNKEGGHESSVMPSGPRSDLLS